CFSLLIRYLPISTLFPYTTLFRSHCPNGPADMGWAVCAIVASFATTVELYRTFPYSPRSGRPRLYFWLWSGFFIALDALVSLFVDRKSTRLNSSHLVISYAVFCLK